MPEFVRVKMPKVGEWSQAKTAPVPDGATVLKDTPAVDGGGVPLPAISDPPTDRAEIRTGAAWGEGTQPAKKSTTTSKSEA